MSTYMVRYPMGGMLSWALQYALGIHKLGHELYLVERAENANACWDPIRGAMTDDATFGWRVVSGLLGRFGLQERFCFADVNNDHTGCSQAYIESILRSADVFIDVGNHGAWLTEANTIPVRVLIDGEPGFRQMKIQQSLDAGETLPQYDAYFTNGLNIGTERSPVPTAGKQWGHVPNPVATDLYTVAPPPPRDAPFTTVMNWQSHAKLEYQGVTYGQKDVEFEKFIELPTHTPAPMEVAVAGNKVPRDRLAANGWRVREALEVTSSFDSYVDYIRSSRGEFSVCKNVFFATNSGWTSDRTAAYLASGRPAVVEDTGFSDLIPTGEGLFAVRTVDEAAAAIEAINADYDLHARAAREIACEYFDARRVMGRLLDEVAAGSQPNRIDQSE
jgi:hypothetical protein